MSESPPITTSSLIVYDGACGACTAFVGERAAFFRRYGFEVAPLQEAWVQEALGLDASTLAEAIHVKLPSGEILRGIDFVIEVAKRVWWLKPMGLLLSVGWVKPIGARVYDAIARRRRRISTVCGLQSRARYK